MKNFLVIISVSLFTTSAFAWTCTQKCPSGNVFSGLTNGKYECLNYQKSAACRLKRSSQEIIQKAREQQAAREKAARDRQRQVEFEQRREELRLEREKAARDRQRQVEFEQRREELRLEREKRAERQARLDQYAHEQAVQRQENKQKRFEQNIGIAKELGGILGELFAK